MAILAKVDDMTGITLSGIGPGLDGMEETKISAVHFLLNRITAFVTVEAKHRVTVALSTSHRILFCEHFMFAHPTRFMIGWLGKLSIRMTTIAILLRGRGRIGIVVALVATQAVDRLPREGVFIHMAGFTGEVDRFVKGVVHFMIILVKRIKLLLSIGRSREKKNHRNNNHCSSFILHGRTDSLVAEFRECLCSANCFY